MAEKHPAKAKIKVIDGPDQGNEYEVMFNPTEYSITATSKTGESGARQQFNEAEIADFSVSLLFDSYEQGTDVREKTEPIAGLLLPRKPGREIAQPQTCLFIWGGFTYKGKLTKVTQKFTMFLSTGIPVRATLDITLTAAMTPTEYSDLNGREQCRKFWIVKAGDRLDLIAYKALYDKNLWRIIAKENKIDNPFDFPGEKDFGRQIVIPDIHR